MAKPFSQEESSAFFTMTESSRSERLKANEVSVLTD
jgi:hypothetical protein